MSFPLGALVWATVGGYAAFRTFVRPYRAIFAEGRIAACPGSTGCTPAITVEAALGREDAYAVASGRIIRADAGVIEMVLDQEPVVLRYAGAKLAPMVAAGAQVPAGACIARVPLVDFAVSRIERTTAGARLVPIEPSTWLAARGLKAAHTTVSRLTPMDGPSWCLGGRSLVVPSQIGRCGIRLAEPPGFALLSVNARME